MSKNKGFTLVEILIAIGIIIVLVGIVFTAGSAAKKVARDNQRRTDIRLLQVKIEAYREQYGTYPVSTADLVSGSFSASAMPKDPGTKADYSYIPLQFSGGTCGASYYLYATLENDNNDTATNINYQTTPPVSSLSLCGGSFPTFSLKIYDVTSPK
jgi:type II secretory pathway pseudopilin PulG